MLGCESVVVYVSVVIVCLGDYVYGRILFLRFCLLNCPQNVVFVKLFVQCSEFDLCWRMALHENYLL